MLIKTLCSVDSNVGVTLVNLMTDLPRIQGSSSGSAKEFWLLHFSDNGSIQEFIPNNGFNWTDTFCVNEKKLFKITGSMFPTNYTCIYGIVVVEDPALLDSGHSELLDRKKTKIGYEYSLKIKVDAANFCQVAVTSNNGVLV